MKLIQNSYLTYQRVLDLFTQWVNDVRSTEEIGINSEKGISMGTQGIYFWKDHPLGDFEIIFDSVNENNYYNASCGVIVSLLSALDNAVAFRSRGIGQGDAQLVKLSISAGYLLPKEDPSYCQRAFVTNELCKISYLFNQQQCARQIKINGITLSDFDDGNPNLLSPAVKSFLDFIVCNIEGNTRYDLLPFNELYSSVWIKNKELSSS
jgi:hypothetical protein